MDLLTLAMACSFQTDPRMTLRVIDVESSGQQYAIHDDTTHKSYFPKTLSEAMQRADSLIRERHSFGVGLMQINYDVWLRPSDYSVEKAFDPCTNVRIGTVILNRNFNNAMRGAASEKQAIWNALSQYNSGTNWNALAYASAVLNGRSAGASKSTTALTREQVARRSSLDFSAALLRENPDDR